MKGEQIKQIVKEWLVESDKYLKELRELHNVKADELENWDSDEFNLGYEYGVNQILKQILREIERGDKDENN